MKKRYIYTLTVIILSIAAIALNKPTELNASDNKIQASLISTSLISESAEVVSEEEVRVLSEEEKSLAFTSYSKALYSEIKGKKPNQKIFTQALQAYHLLDQEGKISKKNLLTVIDFSQPSTKKRLWVIDMENKKVLENIVVSHGRNSGMNRAKSFSNTPNSFQSSIGAFVTAETYTGKHGLSLRLDGMEEGINDNARDRAIVIHTAAYANPSVIKLQGRLGRSLGCPAIQEDKIELINFISEGSVLYIYGDDKNYTSSTKYNNLAAAYNGIDEII